LAFVLQDFALETFELEREGLAFTVGTFEAVALTDGLAVALGGGLAVGETVGTEREGVTSSSTSISIWMWTVFLSVDHKGLILDCKNQAVVSHSVCFELPNMV
jgi:hypothetical protein